MSVTTINTRNQFKGTVAAIHRSPVVSEIEVETPAGIISAVVTTSSIDRLNLRVGDAALAVFKATDVLVAKID
ncbi:MAG TPA: TOBE domain-containing protein [Vineibacter sp.]|nr:TOBE domain-containing protein [Vineibacter sp.]